MHSRIQRLLSRPRVLARAWKALGLRTMLHLVYIRLRGSAQKRYVLHIPGYPHPIYIRGGKSSDAIALYEVLVTREYAVSAALDVPPAIIDGGANIGMASLFFLNSHPGSRVIAIEPDDSNFELCRLNLEPYGGRVKLIRGAVWKSPGHLSLEFGEQEWVHSVREDKSGSVEAFTVPSLIAMCGGRVDLLKLDIEGSELEIFGSAAREWLPSVRNIAIELHGNDHKDVFLSALGGFRYDLSLHCNWSDPAGGAFCYLAICQNIVPESKTRARN